MTFKLHSACFSLTLIAFSCSNIGYTENDSNNSGIDTNAYPKHIFSSVTLFTLDSSQKTTYSNNSGTYEDTSVLEYVGKSGYSFIDKSGMPKTKSIHTYKLDTSQIKMLESILIQQPCHDSLHLDKNCSPIFRNVFVFYDKNKIPIAQAHVCFNCETTVFRPFENYMCDSDNKINYKRFKYFVDKIKHSN